MDTAMDQGGLGDDMEDMREVKLFQYNEALSHAVQCKNPDCEAFDRRCRKVKAHLIHISKCYMARRNTPNFRMDACAACAKTWGLLCFHAKNCATALGTGCHVPQCDYLRAKIAQHSVATATSELTLGADGSVQIQDAGFVDSLERRQALAKQAREETMKMIYEIRAKKAAAAQQGYQAVDWIG